jgi:outer membrane protein
MYRSHKKITHILIFSLLILRGGYAQDAAARMSLNEAVKFAIDNNTAIKAAKMTIKDAELQIQQSKASGLPSVSSEVNLQHFLVRPSLPAAALGFGNDPFSVYNAGYTQRRFAALESKAGVSPEQFTPPQTDGKLTFQLKNNFNGGINVNQLLFSPSYTVALRAASAYRDLVNMQVKKKEDSLRYIVTDAYLPALLIDEGVKTIDKNIKNLEKILVEIKATYKAGFVEQLDVDRIDLSISNLKAQKDNLLRQRAIPINALKLTMGYPIEKPLELVDDINSLLQPLTEAELTKAIDYNKRAEIRELEATEKLLVINVDLQKASALPTVVAFGSLSYGLQGNKFNSLFGVPTSLIGLKATYTIWDNNERKIKEQRARLSLEQFRMVRKDIERVIDFQVSNARIAMNSAQKSYDNAQKNLILAEKIYNVTQKKYKEGVGSSLELTTAERDIYAAQQNIRQAQYDLLVAQRSYVKALGE